MPNPTTTDTDDEVLASYRGQVLYASSTTRIFRLGTGSASGRVVCKEHLGEDGPSRRIHEAAILERLAGVRGVAQRAPGTHSAQVLALHDCGGQAVSQLLLGAAMDARQLVATAAQLAATLADVHRMGVLHRDITPSNILIDTGGLAHLIDFDRSACIDPPLQPPAGGGGSLAYAAPEQTGRMGRSADHRSDLYSLGATLYEMATGRPPFESDDALQLVRDHLARQPIPPARRDPRIPQPLGEMIMRLLAKEPESRYQSADGLLHDLLQLQERMAQGRYDAFDLGTRDFAARLAAPGSLVGRSDELAQLHAAFTHALRGTGRVALIEGAPGVGKSALIQALKPRVTASGGWFVAGKFDQYHRSATAVGALAHALRELGRLLLAEPAVVLASRRKAILARAGRSAALIVQWAPEFRLLLGEQPEPDAVDPAQAESRLVETIVDFLGSIASPERPIVLVLDDLQWAGVVPLRLIERLLGEARLTGLMVIGAFRNAQEQARAEANSILAPMLDHWRRLPAPPVHIALGNLRPAEVADLFAGMLRIPPARAAALAQAVEPHTRGNPFETVEMVNALRREGLLRLEAQGWTWDAAAARLFASGATVEHILATRIAQLGAPARELLACMSCLGPAVESALLREATGLDDDGLRARLRAPLGEGLLLADASPDPHIQFRHDRVQQAVLASLDEAGRHAIQLEMARRLSRGSDFRTQGAQQYLGCFHLLHEPAECRRVALLFVKIAQRLGASALFSLAERYLAGAGELLALLRSRGDDNSEDAQLAFLADEARHVALYSLGRPEEADRLFAKLMSRSDPLKQVEAACLQMRSLDMRGRGDESLALGRDHLTLLGLSVPEGYGEAATAQEVQALLAWVRKDSLVEPWDRPQIADARLRGIAKVLSRMARSAFFRSDSHAHMWVILQASRLWEQHGTCPELAVSLIRAASVFVETRGDWHTGYELVRHVAQVGEALGYEPHTSEARHALAIYAGHWFMPLDDCLRDLARSTAGIQAWGDSSYACYVNASHVELMVDLTPNLSACDIEIEAALTLARRIANPHAHLMMLYERQLLRALRGQTAAPGSFDDHEFDGAAEMASMGRLPFVSVIYHARCAVAAGIFHDTGAVMRHAAQGRAAGWFPAHYLNVHERLFTALGAAWTLQAGAEADERMRGSHESELATLCDWFEARAADNPAGFSHLLQLLKAEQAWAQGEPGRANDAFATALKLAQVAGRPWQRAFITERAGRFYLRWGMEALGRQMLAEACGQYDTWGASGKVERLRHEHPWLDAVQHPAATVSTTARTSGLTIDAIDLLGVLRASQALSSETTLERLSARVIETLAAMTGATRVTMLSRASGQWWLLGQEPGEPRVALSDPAATALLPVSAFTYAERTGEALVVDDAVADDRFGRDAYLAGVPLCSLLAMPIAHQGSVQGMLVLENRLSRAAFNAERLDAVRLIAGQLAVSLANAQLYERLEERVRERTREIEDIQAELVATARRAGKAEIANNVLHNVGNVLTGVNVSAHVVSNAIGSSKIDGLSRAVALLTEHASDLNAFVGQDPRGAVVIGYLAKLADALVAERKEARRELERLVRNVDHIKDIVATQQSNAGHASVTQMAHVVDVIEEAVGLCAAMLEERGIKPLRRFAPMAALPLDKPRLLQILVNLLSNASHAMENLPPPDRLVTLSSQLVTEGSRSRLVIRVRDEGVGIAPADLARIFSHGFTTRATGHGFGLHSSAVAALEMGGRLTAESEGPGQGATFVLELPVAASRMDA